MMPAPMTRILGLASASSEWCSSLITDICYFLKRFGIGNVSIPTNDKERIERLDDHGNSNANMMIGAMLYALRSAAIRAERRSLAGFLANGKQLANVAKITFRFL